jgi:hypothetical protein
VTGPKRQGSRLTPNGLSEWTTAGIRLFAMVGLLLCFAVWFLTGRVEPLFVTGFGGLLAVGQGADALGELRKPPKPPIPPGDPPILESEAPS